jgi:hypothetical protein
MLVKTWKKIDSAKQSDEKIEVSYGFLVQNYLLYNF